MTRSSAGKVPGKAWGHQAGPGRRGRGPGGLKRRAERGPGWRPSRGPGAGAPRRAGPAAPGPERRRQEGERDTERRRRERGRETAPNQGPARPGGSSPPAPAAQEHSRIIVPARSISTGRRPRRRRLPTAHPPQTGAGRDGEGRAGRLPPLCPPPLRRTVPAHGTAADRPGSTALPAALPPLPPHRAPPLPPPARAPDAAGGAGLRDTPRARGTPRPAPRARGRSPAEGAEPLNTPWGGAARGGASPAASGAGAREPFPHRSTDRADGLLSFVPSPDAWLFLAEN